MNEPVIELVGVDPANKGAMLMLESAVEALRGCFPQARLAISWRVPAAVRSRFSLERMLPRDRLRRPWRLAWRLAPNALHRFAGVVPRADVDVILDLSGFAYGDFWPVRKIEDRLLGPLAERRRGRPRLILLPQAFGPFEDPAKCRAMRRALAGASLVFARDETSLRHLEALAPSGAAAVRLAPDFTNLLSAGQARTCADTAYVIPNAKMLEGASAVQAEAYPAFLAACMARLQHEFPNAAWLIHEGAGDLRIAEAVNRTLDTPAPVVFPESAREAKAMIAGATCIVSSRFHGLVSALSSGVPALSCGWTHKYGELMRDYRMEALQADPAQPETWDDALTRLVALAGTGRADLLARAQAQKDATRAMWEAVFACIDAGSSAAP